MKEFLKKNLTPFHLFGILFCVTFAAFYWWKAGQFSDSVLKNKLVLMILWGVITGWITGDFLQNARNGRE